MLKKSIRSCIVVTVIVSLILSTGYMSSNGRAYAADDAPAVYANTIENPGFETGDMTGWTVINGSAFSSDSVSSDTMYWAEGIPYQQEGLYHMNGWKHEETATGRVRSSTFTLGGSGWITFMLGGGRHTDQEYIEIHNADTGEVIARYGNTEWSDANFPKVELGLRLANLVKYKADLSRYLGQNLYIDIVDNGTSDWGLLFADSFDTYYETKPSEGIRADNLYDPGVKEIENPGFETGDMSGWTVVEGMAFGPNSVSDETSYWNEQIPYNQEGQYHLNGWKYDEANTGILRSTTFKLSGTGWITFRMGGGKNTDLVHIDVYDANNNELVARYGNTEFADINFPNVDQGLRLANMVQYRADLRAFVGENLYFEIVDNATSDWGVVFADDFKTYLTSTPTDGVAAINLYHPVRYEPLNPGFESGSLFGWMVVAGNAFGPGSVSGDTTWWSENIPYNQEGDYHLNGWMYDEKKTGILRSSTFTLGGTGWITFKLGGGKRTDLVHVDVYNADTDELIARYGNTEFKDTNFPNIDQGMRLANMVQYKADLSKHLDENLYLEIVDNADSDWGQIFADAFFTYQTEVPTDGVLATNLYSTTPEDIQNPGFETGDLSGWTSEGDAFANAVTSETSFGRDQTPYGQEGTYHAVGADAGTGTLTSSTFKLGGNGFISFLIGGGNDTDNLYVALVRASDHTVLMKSTGAQSDAYQRINWDATPYLGQDLYIHVVDQTASGHINVDDFQVKGSGLIGSWRFNEGQGTKAKDEVRSRNDAVHYVFNDAKYKPNSEPLWRDGVSGKGLLFDGYSTWIARPANEIAKPADEITIEAWVAPRSYEWGDQGKLSAIVNQYDDANRTGYILGMGRHGKWSFQVGINGKWVEAWAADDKPLNKSEWSHIAATYSKTDGKLKLYLNGELVGTATSEKKLAITPANTDFMIGKNNSGAVINGVFTANMFNGLIDEVNVFNQALTQDQIRSDYNTVTATFNGGIVPTPSLDFDRTDYDGDRYRPQYHLIAPGHWMNEPHAPLYFDGKYHIFYQFNPQGPYWHQIHWGHAVSDDMVHWKDMPVALSPDGGSETPDGVWSGSAVVDDNGNPALFFTAGDDKASPNQATGLARSTFKDDGDVDLKNWVYNGTPVTVQAPNLQAEEGEVWYGNFRDPYVWKDGDTWYQLVGSGIKDVGGTALLYTSDDMVHWTYQHPFFVGDYEKYHKTGQVWELPVLLPLGEDSNGTMKYAFFINPWFDHYDQDNVKYVYHWIGTWDKVNNKFVPDHEDPRMFDFGEHFTGPSGMIDGQGRSILYSITQDRRTEQQHNDAGWAHNGGLPLVLSLRSDDTLGVEPIPELQSLRGKKLVDLSQKTVGEANSALAQVQGDMLEVVLEAHIGTAKKVGISLRKTADGAEETKLIYDAENQLLSIDRWKSSLDPDVQKGIQNGKMELDGDLLKLHIYLDRSMIEAYANGKNSITSRVYPTRGDALGLSLWSEGGAASVQKLQVWEMNSAYGSTVPASWPDPQAQTTAVGELPNADFEKGDLSGWTAEGNAFTDKNVTKVNDWGWGGPFNQAWVAKDPERYHLWGINPEFGDSATGSLTSQTFTLGGDGKISLLVGGGQDLDHLYIALVRASDKQILMKDTGNNNEAYRRVTWDASAYKGEALYIQVVDQATGGWGHINIDNLNVPVSIINGSVGGGGIISSQPEAGQQPGLYPVTADDLKVSSANGQTAASLIVDSQKLRDVLNGIKDSNVSTILFDVPIKQGSALDVSLPLAVLQEAIEHSPNLIVTVKSGNVTYDLPLALLHDGIQSNVASNLHVVIEPQSGEALTKIQQATDSSGLKMVSGAFGFAVLLEANGTLSETKNFGKLYISRSITVDGVLDPNTTTAIMIDPSTGKTTFVPATFDVKDGKTVVTIKSNKNGIYTIVQFIKTFTDIRNHWAKHEIELLTSKLIVNGTSASVFAPNATLTRAEFVVIVARALGLSDQAGNSSKLNDVTLGSWYSDAVGGAVHAGIITGYQDGSFRPQQHVTREEMAVMLSRAAAYIGAALGSGTIVDSLLAQYSDGSKVSEWAQSAVSELIASELLKGNQDGLLNPKANLTRAEMAVVMKRFLVQVGFIS
ncbi:S-layer homology domain-containing protein [Paenibacillus sp. PR3]|uniref:beta-fructofuranosidase n=1 Tax=Paenibacillus terricola TaxID=2763503 RepID=A0ABR8MQJ5_9BACL|nr:S-layer homology domain-containing protein [Paenibacillus terricola]MBD3917167.1 S-layer homology domain-containing protein [Paenibacillus terricola]